MTEPASAVFLSYASEDAEAAQRIATALRAAGIEVWFDREELRGGDAWDRRIRERIHDSRLFIPVISAHTEARDEGYFRREWRLAVERAGDMAEKKTFLVPVVIDGTAERGASVPDKFRELQWTRLPGGDTSPAFVERVLRLLAPEASTPSLPAPTPGTLRAGMPAPIIRSSRRAVWAAVALAVAAVTGYLAYEHPWTQKHEVSLPTLPAAPTTAPSASAAFDPPPHSIAVLPFVNMSGDKEQDYFSDGLTEELLNSLARINELQVSARTSSFSFKGKDTDIGTIARKLNVATILEGSVRRSRRTIRITAQLNNAVTGYHLWSQTYDREISDVLQLQTEIANSVANALKVALLGDTAEKIRVGGTRNPAAFDAYLRASKLYGLSQNADEHRAAIDAYTGAIRLDSNYALAYADRSVALADFATYWATGTAVHSGLVNAQSDARKAVSLAPDLAEGHLALASILTLSLDFTGAAQEYQRALSLEPGNARVLARYGGFSADMGKPAAAISAMERAVVLDPLNPEYHVGLGDALAWAGRLDEARHAYTDGQSLAQNNALLGAQTNTWIAFTYYWAGNFQQALVACEGADTINKPICLAIIYDKLGRRRDAETMLAKVRASSGDDGAVFYSMIYAHWGDTAQALDWLEVAMRRRDPYLKFVRAAKYFDPIRNEPRFQAIEQALKFPN